MNPELPPDVIAAVLANRKVEAIKLLRQHSGENNGRIIDLKEAKGVIDTYIAENPQLRRTRYTGERSGFGRMLITGIIALLFYGLYQLFVGGQ